MDSLPSFTNYDVAEFDAWVHAYVGALRERHAGEWWFDVGPRVAGILERVELVRARLVSGEASLRPFPPSKRLMPPYAVCLAEYIDPPPVAPDTEVGAGRPYIARHYLTLPEEAPPATPPEPSVFVAGRYPPAWNGFIPSPARWANEADAPVSPAPRPQPRLFAEPPISVCEPVDTDTAAQRGTGPPRLPDHVWPERYERIQRLKAQGLTQRRIGEILDMSPKNVRRSEERGAELIRGANQGEGRN